MAVLRTSDDRFEALPGYPFVPHYAEVSDPGGGTLRMHYVDEGPRDAPPVLMFHGNPEWSYSFRTLISRLAMEGFRAIAPAATRPMVSRALARPPPCQLRIPYLASVV